MQWTQPLLQKHILSPSRNLGKNEVGLVDEISFEDFLTVMSYFKPPKKKLTEEETEAVRTEKLRCKNTVQTVKVHHSSYTERHSLFSVVCHTLHLITPEHTPQNQIFVCKHKKSCLLPQAGSLYPAWSRDLPAGYKADQHNGFNGVAPKEAENTYLNVSPLPVLFNMHDSDNDGTITLDEYRHVSHYDWNLHAVIWFILALHAPVMVCWTCFHSWLKNFCPLVKPLSKTLPKPLLMLPCWKWRE